jgi:hypothetical protein
MPHSNGRIYTSANGNNPDYGADLTVDVAAVLGVNSGDTGTLCAHANINKWALVKPLKRPGVSPLDEGGNLHAWREDGRGWSGLNGLKWSGVSPKTFIEQMIPHFSNSDSYYEDATVYEKPAGVTISGGPFRINDFALSTKNGIGYNHNAVPRGSYMDGNGIFHTFNRWSQDRNTTPTGYSLDNDITLNEQPEGYTEDWNGFSATYDKSTSNLTQTDESILVQDIIKAMWGGVTSGTVRHGILIYDLDDQKSWIFVNTMPLDNTTTSRSQEVRDLISGYKNIFSRFTASYSGKLHCVDFLTNAPATEGTSASNVYYDESSTTGSYTFVVIPKCIGYICFDASQYNISITDYSPAESSQSSPFILRQYSSGGSYTETTYRDSTRMLHMDFTILSCSSYDLVQPKAYLEISYDGTTWARQNNFVAWEGAAWNRNLLYSTSEYTNDNNLIKGGTRSVMYTVAIPTSSILVNSVAPVSGQTIYARIVISGNTGAATHGDMFTTDPWTYEVL